MENGDDFEPGDVNGDQSRALIRFAARHKVYTFTCFCRCTVLMKVFSLLLVICSFEPIIEIWKVLSSSLG